MIFLTVGTTHFDDLVKAADDLAGAGMLNDSLICQIGRGTYEPAHAESFRFRKSIDDLLRTADLVICHGGATVMSLLQMRKRFVAIANTVLAGDHQTSFLDRLAKEAGFAWGRDVARLGDLIIESRKRPVPELRLPRLADDLVRYL